MERSFAFIADTVWFTPALFVLVALMALVLEVIRRKQPIPVGASASRPPGESIRLNLDNLNEKLILRLLITIGMAVMTGIAARGVAYGSNLPLVNAVMFGGSGIALALTLWSWSLVSQWHKSNLSFEAERMVGRELNLLMLDGCRVFHDLVDPRLGNIDHIIVAPHAIFTVETRTWRQKPEWAEGGKPSVIFNGRELQFPSFTTEQPIKQAARNARWLEKFLIRTTGIKLPVHPILTLPGWQVQCTSAATVAVVSPDQIPALVVDRAAPELYAAQRQRIINVLDEKCRCQPT